MTDAMNHFNAAALRYALLVTIHWKNDVSQRRYWEMT
jgi:hypothetical protein